MRLASLLAAMATVFALAPLPTAPAHAQSAPPPAQGYLYTGVYPDMINGAGGTDLVAADFDRFQQFSGQRPTFAGTFVSVEGGTWVRTILERAWEAQSTPVLNLMIDASARAIAAGQHDQQIIAFADGAKPWFDRGEGRSALFAPLPEMNGRWTPYGCDPVGYQQAYNRIRDLMRQRGLDETMVRWVFAPNNYSDRDCGPYGIGDYYPGGANVDLIGFSAYNFGGNSWNRHWSSPAEIYGSTLDELRTFAAEKPYLVLQTATAPVTGTEVSGSPDRQRWFHDMYTYLAADPNVVGFLYFNLDKSQAGEVDWRFWYSTHGEPGLAQGGRTRGSSYAWPLRSWFTPGPLEYGPVTRAAGSNRIETAVNLSQRTHGQTGHVVLARADAYPDALAGGPLAARLGAPILLTNPARLDGATRAEIQRLGAANVTILGGLGAVSAAVEAELRSLGLTVDRIAGPSRFDTARLIAERVGGNQAYVVEGANADPGRGWPDAVAVGALAAHQRRPILLVTRDGLPDGTAEALRSLQVTDAVIVGGEGAVSAGVANAIAASGVRVERVAGSSRYDTSRLIADRSAAAGLDPSRLWLATGANFPDALAAAPAVAANGGVLVLTDGTRLPGTTRSFVQAQPRIQQVQLVGGSGVLGPAVAGELLGVAAP